MLSIQQRRTVGTIKNHAEDGNIKGFIDGIDTFLSQQHLDLPTVIDADASIVNKFAVLDIAKEYPDNAMAKYTQIINRKPAVSFWYKSDNSFVPLTQKVMEGILKQAVNYLDHHYDNADDDLNQNVVDKIGGLN